MRKLTEPVVAVPRLGLSTGPQALPLGFDDLSGEFGLQVYREMMRDPAIEAALNLLKGLILNTSWKVKAAEAETDTEQAQADELAAFVEAAFSESESPLELVLDEALDSLAIGAQPCEIIWRYGQWRGRPALMPESIEAKPREDVAIVRDEFDRLVGYAARKPGTTPGLVAAIGVVRREDILPKEKFFCVVHKKSVLRSAYNAWLLKTRVIPEMYRQLQNFATGRIIGFLPEDAGGADGLVGNEEGEEHALQTPEQAMLETLIALTGNSAGVLPHGSDLRIEHGSGTGEAFLKALDWCDRQMVMGIISLYQGLLEAQHSSKASSEAAFSGLVMLNYRRRVRLAEEIKKQIIRPMVRMNFGEDALRFCPAIAVERDVLAERAYLIDAVSRLFASGFLHESQLAEMDRILGLPPRDVEAVEEEGADIDADRARLEDELRKLAEGNSDAA